jgi:fructokinase
MNTSPQLSPMPAQIINSSDQSRCRIGVDLGGSKIEGILMGPGGTELARYRVATPRNDYSDTIGAIVELTQAQAGLHG